MNQLGRIFLKGLLTTLPIGLTLYFVYWIGVTAESVLAAPIKAVIDAENYWPGMGLVAGFGLLFVVGLAVNAFIVRRVLTFGENLLLRVPVIKTIYAAIRDITRLVQQGGKGDLQRVVTVPFGPGRVIGFVTQEHADVPGAPVPETDLVAVYLPMSYQIGGYTVYLPRSQIQATSLSVEEAMRVVLTGAVQGSR